MCLLKPCVGGSSAAEPHRSTRWLTTQINMNTLPVDLLPEVLRHSTVLDTLRMKEAFSVPGGQAVSAECDRRLCIRRYLARFFKSPEKLLEAMSRSKVVLSGSRAADFYVPGSAGRWSDFDFYAPGEPDLVAAFVKMGEGAGIEWIKPIEKMREMLELGKGSIVIDEFLWDDIKSEGFIEHAESKGYTVLQAPLEFPENVTIEVKNKVLEICMSGESVYPDATNIIYGKLKHEGGTSEVQLIVAPYREGLALSFTLGFHLSCVQSYISAHTSGHLYGHVACDMKAYKWAKIDTRRGNSTSYCHRAQESFEKYVSRGYTLVKVPLGRRKYNLRSSDDDMCINLPPYNFSRTPEYVVEMYKSFSRNMIWLETEDRIEPLIRPAPLRVSISPSSAWWFAENRGALREELEDLGTFPTLLTNGGPIYDMDFDSSYY